VRTVSSKGARLSLRAFAKRQGVTENAVRKAVASGRLSKSLGSVKGKPFIADPELADAEWVTNVQPQPDKGKVIPQNTLVEAQRSATLERARKLKLDNDLKDGRLMEVATVKREWFEVARTIRKSMQNIPARLSAEIAAESDAARVYLKLDAAIREALTSLADAVEAVAQ
jgi:phage terminase Nu1 subunit (DNA packaging protein)